MEFFVTGGLFLIVVFALRSYFKGVKVVLPKYEEDILEIPLSRDYEEETAEELKVMEIILNEKGLTDEMKKKVEEMNEKLDAKKKYWHDLELELMKLVEERKEFITTETMYPRNYAIKLSDIEVALEKVKDYKKNNPFKKDYDIEETVETERDLVKEFLTTKKKIELEMNKMKDFEKKLKGKKQEVDYFSEKQKMYLELMNGNTKNAKRSLNKILKKIE